MRPKGIHTKILPEGTQRVTVGIRLPPDLVRWIDSKGSRTRVIETAVKYLRDKEVDHGRMD